MAEPVLRVRQRGLLEEARRAILVTISPSGLPRPVPICFAVAPPPLDVLWTPLDEKPKRWDDPRRLARVRDILERPRVALLVDRWDEDWSRLAWLRLEGTARLLEPEDARAAEGVEPGRPEHAVAVAALRARYPQYTVHALEQRPMIRVTVSRASGWGDPVTTSRPAPR